jgi:hypothetical protein
VSWGVEVLVEGLLTAEAPIALVTLEYWSVSWGIYVLLQCSLTVEVSIATLTVFGHFRSTIASTLSPKLGYFSSIIWDLPTRSLKGIERLCHPTLP